jgi:phosphoglycerate dehydrogenase-like enzyme
MAERWTIFAPEPFPESAIAVLDARFDVRCGRSGAAYCEDELIDLAACADALAIYSRDRISERVLAALPQLKVIAKGGSRPSSNVDIDAAQRRGVRVLWTPGANAVSVAEMTLALMLSLARDLPGLRSRLSQGGWRDFGLLGRELAGTTVGLIGFGAVGREVAARCRAFGQQVLVFDPHLDVRCAEALGADGVDLHELLARSDIVSLHCELNAATARLIDGTALARMKSGAWLINTARGGLIDEDALLTALDAGRLAGAALDVFAVEPPPVGSSLVGHPRVLCTPHVAAFTAESIHRESAWALEDAARVLQGLAPRYAPAQG